MSRYTLEDVERLPTAMRDQVRAQMQDKEMLDSVRVALSGGLPPNTARRMLNDAADVPRGTEKPSNKYGNQPTSIGGLMFQSKWEATRYQELCNQVDVGLITDLQLQVSFALEAWTAVGPVRLGAYIADFTFRRAGELVIEDAKSEATRRKELYVWKKKHVEAQYGITITETQRRRRKK